MPVGRGENAVARWFAKDPGVIVFDGPAVCFEDGVGVAMVDDRSSSQ